MEVASKRRVQWRCCMSSNKGFDRTVSVVRGMWTACKIWGIANKMRKNKPLITSIWNHLIEESLELDIMERNIPVHGECHQNFVSLDGVLIVAVFCLLKLAYIKNPNSKSWLKHQIVKLEKWSVLECFEKLALLVSVWNALPPWFEIDMRRICHVYSGAKTVGDMHRPTTWEGNTPELAIGE